MIGQAGNNRFARPERLCQIAAGRDVQYTALKRLIPCHRRQRIEGDYAEAGFMQRPRDQAADISETKNGDFRKTHGKRPVARFIGTLTASKY